MLSSKISLFRKTNKSSVQSYETFDDCQIEFNARVYTLKESEVVSFCEENQINRKFLYYFNLDSHKDWEYNQYFTSTKESPLLAAVVPLLTDGSLFQGTYFFICQNPEDSNYYIWGAFDGVILTIGEEFPLSYKTYSLAVDSIEVIASLKGISKYEIIDVESNLLDDQQLRHYQFKPVTKSFKEKVLFTLIITGCFSLSVYLGWNTSFGLY
ncbi:hypothetical protein F0231_06180 [Vibrio sp. RE86]|uniref:hypothetical protein n=1 Tax=Vibrio sp. RE86 TaxID=2607605 RepID=UPI001493330A|nr:hypothetical protein [Vibrio sp. RE86]NOH79327.1 hypothetical protein [Vibrio sp. RE86]